VANATQGAPDALESLLCEAFAGFVGRDDTLPEDNFFALGGDSIQALRLATSLRRQGIACQARDLFRHPTPRGLAATLWARTLQPATTADPTLDAPGTTQALLPLETWFFDLCLVARNHWVQGICLTFDTPVDTADLVAALQDLHRADPVFRHRWRAGADGWHWSEDDASDDTPVLHVATFDDTTSLRADAEALIARIDISDGPLSAVGWYPGTGRLVWVIHHLAVDTLSWATLIEALHDRLSGKSRTSAPSSRAPLWPMPGHRTIGPGSAAAAPRCPRFPATPGAMAMRRGMR
jgi:aryl carrier-like protein